MDKFNAQLNSDEMKEFVETAVKHAMAESNETLSLSEYSKIETKLYQDRIFNLQQRNLFRKLHNLETNLDNSPKIDVTVVAERVSEPTEKTRAKAVKFKTQSKDCSLSSFEITHMPSEMSYRIDVNKAIRSSEHLTVQLQEDTRFPFVLSLEIVRADFFHTFCLEYSDEYGEPFVLFATEDCLHQKRNEIRHKLSLPKKKYIDDEIWETVDTRTYNIEFEQC